MRKRILIGGAIVLLLVVGVGAAFALSTWNDVKRVSIDREAIAANVSPPADSGQSDQGATDDGPVAAPTTGDGLTVTLLVGSDSRADLASTEGFGDFQGNRADVVMVLIKPASGTNALLLSLPRDLLVDDVCSDAKHRLNDALEGCGDAMNGPTALTQTVENVIGQTVDHFALVDLAGFQEAVDAIGGYEICLDNAVRDRRADLDLPKGCTHASGAQTLAWLRSRHTQELTAGGWHTIPGVSDLTRNERQRKFLLDMMSRLSNFGSPSDVADIARVIAPYVTVDSDLTLFDAVDLAWAMRGLGRGTVDQLTIPVSDATTSAGAAVLVAQVDIADLVASALAPETADDVTGALAG
ncbi:MAG: LCP family protein [Acidimicrobiia bacterium]